VLSPSGKLYIGFPLIRNWNASHFFMSNFLEALIEQWIKCRLVISFAKVRSPNLILRVPVLRLPALMDLYIHPLYVLVSKILFSILNSSAPSILYIILYPLYPLWDSLVTLSKYIHVCSSFEGLIETNLMVQSKFNLDFWFVSYSIFFSLFS
jgi:hypothetical protein